jgi:hypothetical protein
MNRDDRLQGPRAVFIVLLFMALYGAAGIWGLTHG